MVSGEVKKESVPLFYINKVALFVISGFNGTMDYIVGIIVDQIFG